MRNLLFFAGGVLAGIALVKYGPGFLDAFNKKAIAPPETSVDPHTNLVDNNPMVQNYNATPAATFSPARTDVVVPAAEVGSVINLDQAGNQVHQ